MPDTQPLLILDGPVGTELTARGVRTELPLWSARAIADAPDVLASIHCGYAKAGARMHTAVTFRTQPRHMGPAFESAARTAVAIARAAVPAGHRVAGSIAPVEDCYRPDLSPGVSARHEHRALASVLVDAGVDLLLCETFPAGDEALVALEAAMEAADAGARARGLAARVPCWLALTAGPDADLMTPAEMGRIARRAVASGAAAVLVNCVPARATLDYVAALADAGVPFGAYANAGSADDVVGWCARDVPSTDAYLGFAEKWVARGATLVGSCCGTGPAHIARLAQAFAARGTQPR